jgi:hypothetical protein
VNHGRPRIIAIRRVIVVTNEKGASGNGQSVGAAWVTTTTWSPAGGRPFQPLV